MAESTFPTLCGVGRTLLQGDPESNVSVNVLSDASLFGVSVDALTETVPGSQEPALPVPQECAEGASAPTCRLEHRSRDPAREAKRTVSSPPGCHRDAQQLL